MQQIDTSIKKDKHMREKKKAAAMSKLEESSDEERPYNKFTKNIQLNNLVASPIFKDVYNLNQIVNSIPKDTAFNYNFKKQIDERK